MISFAKGLPQNEAAPSYFQWRIFIR